MHACIPYTFPMWCEFSHMCTTASTTPSGATFTEIQASSARREFGKQQVLSGSSRLTSMDWGEGQASSCWVSSCSPSNSIAAPFLQFVTSSTLPTNSCATVAEISLSLSLWDSFFRASLLRKNCPCTSAHMGISVGITTNGPMGMIQWRK